MTISRRAFLSAATLAAGSLVLARPASAYTGSLPPGMMPGSLDPATIQGGIQAADLEVATVTDTSVAFTWATYAPGILTPYGLAQPTVNAGEEVLVGPADGGRMRVVHADDRPRGYHHVVVEGLEPGRAYRFECRSNGVRAVPSLLTTRRPSSPELTGTFTTLTPPPGRSLGTVAITNDTHIGKPFHDGIKVEGIGLKEAEGARRFPTMQLEELLAGVAGTSAAAVVVNGDCTDGNSAEQASEFKRIMDGFGEQGSRWFATRGNHDNYEPGSTSADGDMAEVPDHFGIAGAPRQRHWAARVGELRLIGVDSSTVHDDGGYISPEQLDAVHAELLSDADRPTFVFAHHPITRDAAYSNIAGPDFIVPEDQARRLQESLAATPGAAAMFAGHTHRTRRGRADVGHVDSCERGACLGYPGGYTLLDVREGGYMVTFHRTPSRESLDWSARTRWSLAGFEPEYMLGSTEDRNYSVHRGF